jgi:hypothetical protein
MTVSYVDDGFTLHGGETANELFALHISDGPDGSTWATPIGGSLITVVGSGDVESTGLSTAINSNTPPANSYAVIHKFTPESATGGDVVGALAWYSSFGSSYRSSWQGGSSAGNFIVALGNGSALSGSSTTGHFVPTVGTVYWMWCIVTPHVGGGQTITGWITPAGGGTILTSATGTDATGGITGPGSVGFVTASGSHHNGFETRPVLSVSPATGTAVDAASTVSVTVTQLIVQNTLSTVMSPSSGAGTISTASPASGVAYTYTPPATGTGSVTLTTTDSVTGVVVVCTVAYAPATALTATLMMIGPASSAGQTLTGNSTGGTGGNTYQWQSSTTPGGTFANISGMTSQTEVIQNTNPTGLPYWVRCAITSGGNTVFSYAFAAGAVYSGSPIWPFGVVPLQDPITVAMVSDSTANTGTNFDLTTFTTALTDWYYPSSLTVNNLGAQSGSSTQGWVASVLAGTFIPAMPAGKYIFPISLGDNDSRSVPNGGETAHLPAATWAANIATICAGLLIPKYAGSIIVLMGTGYVAAPTSIGDWDDASNVLMNQYNNLIPSLCNGTTILDGTTNRRFYTFASNPLFFLDGVHENTTGGTVLANQYAANIVSAIAIAKAAPAASKVQSGQAFGLDGELTGSYSGSGSYTGAANVRLGTNRGDGVTGTLAVPTASQVLATIAVDATTGNVVLPTAGQVESGITFGPASATTGTFAGGGIDSGLFIGATVSAVVDAGNITLAFTGAAPAAAILQAGGIFCSLTDGSAAPGKLPIATATAVDSTHVRLTFAPAFAVAPQANDTALIG